MNEIKIFNNTEFGQVRSTMIDNEPWFVGKDVATALGYKDNINALKQHVDAEDKLVGCQNTTPSVADTLGRLQYPTWINESGLYALIFGSKLESAKKFKHWVTSEVLPELRKTGTYSLTDKPNSYEIEDPAARARRWAEEYEEKKALEAKAAELEEQNKQMLPKAEFHDAVTSSKDCITVEEMAKILRSKGIAIGRNRLYEWLRIEKVLRANNLPYQEYMESGYFTVEEYTFTDKKTGESRLATKTKITPKCQKQIVKTWTDFMNQ